MAKSIEAGGDMSLEVLPDLILLEIFSFLPVRDLKNIRLVSTRMSKAMLNNDKRIKTWTFDVSRELPQQTDKVFEYNLNITVKINQLVNYNEDFYIWLIKHSSRITAIKLSERSKLPEKVIDSLSQLKQVRILQLEILINYKNTVKTLLFSLGSQLESLTMNDMGGSVILNETDLSNINLVSLKHLKLNNFNREMISSILKIVPATIESLDLLGQDIESSSIMKYLTNLKCLRIIMYYQFRKPNLNLPTKLLCKSLTSLDLVYVDLEDLELVDTDLPSLKILELQDCKIKSGLLKNLLKKSSMSLHKLTLYNACIIDNEDLECSLPALTTIELNNMRNITWLSQLISACSTSLTTLKLDLDLDLDSCSLDELPCDLPVLTTLELNNMIYIKEISQLISSCSRSLTTLKLYCIHSCSLDELTCDLPVLTTLELLDMEDIKGMSQLISACSRSLTTLKLYKIQSCSLDELTCDLPVLTTLELSYMSNIGLSQLISVCSRSLTTFKLYCIKSCSVDELASELPTLKVMSIHDSNLNINNFLRKCSSSLQNLYLNEVSVKFAVNVPNLKELHLMRSMVNGFTNLVSPKDSSLEIIGLSNVGGSIWDDIDRCRFSNLKVVYMIDLDLGKIAKLKTSIITPHVQFITDYENWKQYLNDRILFGHVDIRNIILWDILQNHEKLQKYTDNCLTCWKYVQCL